jgi:hypothetical protein
MYANSIQQAISFARTFQPSAMPLPGPERPFEAHMSRLMTDGQQGLVASLRAMRRQGTKTRVRSKLSQVRYTESGVGGAADKLTLHYRNYVLARHMVE